MLLGLIGIGTSGYLILSYLWRRRSRIIYEYGYLAKTGLYARRNRFNKRVFLRLWTEGEYGHDRSVYYEVRKGIPFVKDYT